MHPAPRPRPPAASPALGAVRHFAPDQTIYREGERATHFILVLDGLVRSCSTFPDGRRFIGAFFAVGDLFGFECHSTHQAAAETVCDSTLVFYPARDPLESLAALPHQILAAIMRRTAQAHDHARLLGRFSAMEKLAAFLRECAARSQSRDIVTLEMTRQDIADYLGLTVETVSRCLAQLKRDGAIEFLSPRRLKLRAGGN